MKTELTQTAPRDVQPQWGGGKGNNLGEFTLNVTQFTGAGVRDLVTDDLMAEALADMVNGQLHIRFGSRACQDKVKASGLRARDKEEKPDAFFADTLTDARAIAKRVLPGFSPDYTELFREWAREDFAKRGERQDRRPVLADYDKAVAGFEAKWDGWDADKRKLALERFALTVADVDAATAVDVIAALKAKYQRPVAVDADELFA